MNFCGKCGTKVDKAMSFCPFCGSELTAPNNEVASAETPVTIIETTPLVEADPSSDFVESVPEITVEEPVSGKVNEPEIEASAHITETEITKTNNEDNIADTGLTYVMLPEDKSSSGASAMGIIAFILGLISLSSIVSSFMLTIDVYKQLTISAQSFAITASSAVPGVIAIILSQKAIDNGYKCGISKAAEILGAIGAFCHVGVLFILLLGIFI